MDIELILLKNPARPIPFSKESIMSNLETLRKDWEKNQLLQKKQQLKPVLTSDHQPCMGLDGKCGSTDFQRTGTCYVCVHCGSSQGCS